MALQTLKALTAAAALAVTGIASAGTSSFIMVNGVNIPGIDVSLTVQASSTPGYAYDFIVANNSDQGSVTGVYFEEGWSGKIWGAGLSTGPATLNAASLNPYIDGWEGPKVSRTVGVEKKRYWIGRGYRETVRDRVEDGIAPGQAQVFSFNTDTDKVSLDSLEDVLGEYKFGVAIRMQDLINDDQAAGWGLVEPISEPQESGDPGDNITGVPTPSAALAGLVMLGLAGTRRRRA